jgi:hypothetical protein
MVLDARRGEKSEGLPAIRASVLFIVTVVSVAADWVRHEHASRCGDGDGAGEQQDGGEPSECAELHDCHLLSHDPASRRGRSVPIANLDLALSVR